VTAETAGKLLHAVTVNIRITKSDATFIYLVFIRNLLGILHKEYPKSSLLPLSEDNGNLMVSLRKLGKGTECQPGRLAI
jgi:hypothetical protein